MHPWLPSRLASQLPGPCEVCRRWSDRPFCAACLSRHGGPRRRCPHCGLAGDGSRPCSACAQERSPIDACHIAFDYAFPWDGLIHAFKFGGRIELARPLADALHRVLPVQGPGHAAVDLVLPVPLSPQRLRERGYNQAWLLARRVARALDRPADDQALLRPLDTPHQTGLARAERRRNLRGAFMVDPSARPRLAGRRVALVDDVVTTGSTVREAARELRRGGAASVEVWALARTP